MDSTGHIFSFIFSTLQEKRHLHGSQELSITVISSAWCLKKNLQSAVNYSYAVNPQTLPSELSFHSGGQSFNNPLCDLPESDHAHHETSESDYPSSYERKRDERWRC